MYICIYICIYIRIHIYIYMYIRIYIYVCVLQAKSVTPHQFRALQLTMSPFEFPPTLCGSGAGILVLGQPHFFDFVIWQIWHISSNKSLLVKVLPGVANNFGTVDVTRSNS